MARYVYWFNVAELTEFQCGVIDGMSMGPNGPGHGLIVGTTFNLPETYLGVPEGHKNMKDIVSYLERLDVPKVKGPMIPDVEEASNIVDAMDNRLSDLFDVLNNEPFMQKHEMLEKANNIADIIHDIREALECELGDD